MPIMTSFESWLSRVLSTRCSVAALLPGHHVQVVTLVDGMVLAPRDRLDAFGFSIAGGSIQRIVWTLQYPPLGVRATATAAARARRRRSRGAVAELAYMEPQDHAVGSSSVSGVWRPSPSTRSSRLHALLEGLLLLRPRLRDLHHAVERRCDHHADAVGCPGPRHDAHLRRAQHRCDHLRRRLEAGGAYTSCAVSGYTDASATTSARYPCATSCVAPVVASRRCRCRCTPSPCRCPCRSVTRGGSLTGVSADRRTGAPRRRSALGRVT